MTDPVADMLNRIKNAQAVGHETVSFGFSKIKYEIALIFKRYKLVKDVEKKSNKGKKIIKTTLNKEINKLNIKKISKPGQRVYVANKDIKPIKSGYGISIISTSKGLMTNKEAKKNKLGGEIICEIW